MTTKTSLETIWHVPDELWNLIAPLLGPEKAPGTPGRPAVPFRKIFDGIIYVLRTGCQWSALPRSEFAPKSTVWGRFRQWSQAGVFQQTWALTLKYYDFEVGIAWKWQSLDGVITKAPLGGEATGPSPVDRAKSGTKRSVLSDGRGAPLSVIVKGANAQDKALQSMRIALRGEIQLGVKRVQTFKSSPAITLAIERDFSKDRRDRTRMETLMRVLLSMHIDDRFGDLAG